MVSVALVIGAGGVTGHAYSVGVLAALAEVTGWDPREAGVIVGTSAGAGLGATLRAGISAADHYAGTRHEPLSPEAQRLVDRQPPLDVGTRQPLEGMPLPQSPLMVAEGLLGRWPPRLGLVVAGAQPRGSLSPDNLGERVSAVYTERWPIEPLWLCAVKLKNGERVVFGRDDVEVDHVGTAVKASSAVPGWFAPVTIGGEEYIDGGTHSPTNADLVTNLGFDLVIVVAPMAARPDPADAFRQGPIDGLKSLLSLGSAGRALNHSLLNHELAPLRAKPGTAVLVFEPTAADITAMGPTALDDSRSGEVAEHARNSARTQLERDADDILRLFRP